MLISMATATPGSLQRHICKAQQWNCNLHSGNLPAQKQFRKLRNGMLALCLL